MHAALLSLVQTACHQAKVALRKLQRYPSLGPPQLNLSNRSFHPLQTQSPSPRGRCWRFDCRCPHCGFTFLRQRILFVNKNSKLPSCGRSSISSTPALFRFCNTTSHTAAAEIAQNAERGGKPEQLQVQQKTANRMALTWALLRRQDASTSEAIISTLGGDEQFEAASKVQAQAIRTRDREDDEKLARGIKAAIEKHVLPADLVPEPYKQIDVLGKTPTEVAQCIVDDLGDAARTGCVVVMCGLSGTGKGTTVAQLKSMLPNAQTWSNGNIFRALTLLCARWCAQKSKATGKTVPIEAALTPENLASFMKCLSFGKFGADGGFDTRIYSKELGVDELVGKVQLTLLKGPEVGKNIPTVAEQTQGEVIAFVAGALQQLAEAGKIVLLEGRAQTVNFVRTPYRYTLTLSDPVLVGKRRVAQVAAAAALKELSPKEDVSDEKPPSPTDIISLVRKKVLLFLE